MRLRRLLRANVAAWFPPIDQAKRTDFRICLQRFLVIRTVGDGLAVTTVHAAQFPGPDRQVLACEAIEPAMQGAHFPPVVNWTLIAWWLEWRHTRL